MIAAFLIGAGVGLLAGAGLGFIVAALMANARVEQARSAAVKADARAGKHWRRAQDLLAELDALSIAGPDTAAGVREDIDAVPVNVWTDSGIARLVNGVTQGHPETCQVHIGGRCTCEVGEHIRAQRAASRPDFDANPTILLAPGQTYAQWYAEYADRLDQEQPGWWDHMSGSAAGELIRLAEERRHETYAQDELDNDRIPTREGYERRPDQFGMAIYPRPNSTVQEGHEA